MKKHNMRKAVIWLRTIQQAEKVYATTNYTSGTYEIAMCKTKGKYFVPLTRHV